MWDVEKTLKFVEITVCYVDKTLTQINLKTIDINGKLLYKYYQNHANIKRYIIES